MSEPPAPSDSDIDWELEIVPPRASETRQPTTATDVDVTGIGGTILIDFFYVDPNLAQRAFDPRADQTGLERDGDTVTIRTEPVARIALPLSVALDLMATLVEVLGGEMPAVGDAVTTALARLADARASLPATEGPSR